MKCSPSIFYRIRVCWDTTDIVAVTTNGVCLSCIYQWSMRCPCSNYHVPLFLSLSLSFFLMLEMSNLDLWIERGREKLLIPMLCCCSNQRRRKTEIVFLSISLLFFSSLYVDMTMTHTVRTGDLGAYMIGKKNARWVFLSCIFVKLPPTNTTEERTNNRTSERSIHKGISLSRWHWWVWE
jgi:hypothetical protein